MGIPRLLQDKHYVALLAPVDIANAATGSDVVNVQALNWFEARILAGVITTDSLVITVEECDNTTPSNTTAIPFWYKKNAAVGTDTEGDATYQSTAATGVTLTASDDGKSVTIAVDPRTMDAGYGYIRVKLTPGGSMSVCLVAIDAPLDTVYKGNGTPSVVV